MTQTYRPNSLSNEPRNAVLRSWWRDGNDAYEGVIAAVKFLDANESWVHNQNTDAIRLYSQRAYRDLTGLEVSQRRELSTERLRLNVVQQLVDAVVAQVATNRPRLFHLTDKGDFTKQRLAKDATAFVDGQFYDHQQYRKSILAMRHAAIYGTALQKICVEGESIYSEVVSPHEILVDSRRPHPRHIYQYTEVPREVLMELFPAQSGSIASASSGWRQHSLRNLRVTDTVGVAEAWHLRSSESAEDGRHILCTSHGALIDEPWEMDGFPFAMLRFQDNPEGFWGLGLAELLAPLQTEVNYLLHKIQRAMTLSTAQIWLQRSQRVIKQIITNEDLAINYYQGPPPVFATPPPLAGEFFSHLQFLLQQCYQISGISLLHATSQKPAGLNSGKAIDSYNDVQSSRFLHLGQAFENFHVDCGNLYTHACEQLSRGEESYKVRGKTKQGFVYLDFRALLEAGSEIAVYPTSFFAREPAGRWNQIERMLQAGFLGREEGMALLDYPDLASVTSPANAPWEYLQMVVEDILDHGAEAKVTLPEVGAPLALAALWLPKIILQAEIDGAESANVAVLKEYYAQVKVMQAQTQAPPQQGAPLGQQQP